MARTKPPSFDFFPDDFIAGTYHLPAEAVGIYVRLLCYQWNNGGIPTEEIELARIAGVDTDAMRTHMRTIMLKFMPDGCGAMKNARLEREREHKLSVIEKSKQAADTRWAKEKARKEAEALAKLASLGNADGHADAMRTHMPPTSNVQLPTSSDKIPPNPLQGESGGSSKEEKPDKPKRKPKTTIGEFQIPSRLDCPEVREALQAFERMRLNTGRMIRDRSNVCRGWDHAYRDKDHLLVCINLAVSNEWQGIKPDYVDLSKPNAVKKSDPYANAKVY